MIPFYRNCITLLVFFMIGSVVAQSNALPVITANARQAYCPSDQIQIAPNFTITDSDDTGIEAFFIQISAGYTASADQLILTGNHPAIIATWSIVEGKLSLTPSSGTQILYADLQAAVRDVVFVGNTFDDGEKFFSFNIGAANFLPSTNHFYEYVPDLGIDWETARQAAENRTYFGLQGYLATIGSQDEAQITGEQAAGAGWIGGSDVVEEGVWRWVTGPEAGTIFWNGGTNGTTPNFAFWNNNPPEPNNSGDEDYAHVTDPNVGLPGSWNDLDIDGNTSGPYQPKGYVVEYGGMPGDPIVSISASTSVYIPQILTTTNGDVCQAGTINLTATPSEGDVLWYDALTGGNLVGMGTTFMTPVLTVTTTYYVAVSVNGCVNLPRTPVVATVFQPPTITSVENDIICGNGIATVRAFASEGDVYWYDSLTSATPLFIGNEYTTPSILANTTFYVEASISGCISTSRTPVTVTIDSTVPSFEILETYTVCIDQGSVLVEAMNPLGNYTYQWQRNGEDLGVNTASVSVSLPGRYSVQATSIAGCLSEPKVFNVIASEIATITIDDVIINDSTLNNFIRIGRVIFGAGAYEFAIDNSNGPYSNETLYQNLTPGRHTLYLRDKNGCGITEFEFIVLDYPQFFTPNNDGVNDLWSLKGYDRNFYTTSDIFIYDRYGKFIARVEPTSAGWNGTYNGKQLPSSDYWFTTKLTDMNGFTVERKGHFSLLRK